LWRRPWPGSVTRNADVVLSGPVGLRFLADRQLQVRHQCVPRDFGVRPGKSTGASKRGECEGGDRRRQQAKRIQIGREFASPMRSENDAYLGSAGTATVIEPGRTGVSGTQALCCVLRERGTRPRHSMPPGSRCCLRTPRSPNGPRRQLRGTAYRPLTPWELWRKPSLGMACREQQRRLSARIFWFTSESPGGGVAEESEVLHFGGMRGGRHWGSRGAVARRT
jgi:hypothetical protein